MPGISDLLTQIKDLGHRTAEYTEKYIHAVPETPVVDREQFILAQCKGHVVLDIGCTGPLSEAVKKEARGYYGIDASPGPWWQMDLDILPPATPEPGEPQVTLVICGEILEHLSNPGFFLKNLKALYSAQAKIFSVPNAFCETGMAWMRGGRENVNDDHVAYYSYKTLTTLFSRYEYNVIEWYWYKGRPRLAEGLIFVVR